MGLLLFLPTQKNGYSSQKHTKSKKKKIKVLAFFFKTY